MAQVCHSFVFNKSQLNAPSLHVLLVLGMCISVIAGVANTMQIEQSLGTSSTLLPFMCSLYKLAVT